MTKKSSIEYLWGKYLQNKELWEEVAVLWKAILKKMLRLVETKGIEYFTYEA